MKLVKTLWLVCALFVSGAVFARTPEPIVNYPNVAIAAASGKSLSADDTQKLIRTVGAARGWVIAEAADGKLLAKKSWNNKHTIVAEIAFSAGTYSITYRDSVAMNYGETNGVPVIHPHYNKFVREFVDAIRLEQMML